MELFKTEPIGISNRPAQEVYDIVNSKNTPISTRHPLLNATVFPAVNLLRRKISNKNNETLIEEELVGLRTMNKLSAPILYGSEYPRITTKTTELIGIMSNPDHTANGQNIKQLLITQGVSMAKKFISNKLGVKFPYSPIPSKIISELDGKSTYDYTNTLKKIKSNSKGNASGKFISAIFNGDVKNIGKNIISNSISSAKAKLNKLITKTISSIGSNKPTIIDTNLKFPSYNDNIYSKKMIGDPDTLPMNIAMNSNVDTNSNGGLKHSFINTKPKLSTNIKYKEITKENKYNYLTDGKTYKDSVFRAVFDKADNKPTAYASNMDQTLPDSYKGYTGEPTNERLIGVNNSSATSIYRSLDETDNEFVKIQIFNKSLISTVKKSEKKFYSSVTGITDNLTADFSETSFAGSPLKNYMYNSTARAIGFTLRLYSTDSESHVKMWDDIDWLKSLAIPITMINGMSIPHILTIAIGGIFYDLKCILTSIDITIDESAGWINPTWKLNNDYYKNPINDDLVNTYTLPSVCDIQLSFNVLNPLNVKSKVTMLKNQFNTLNKKLPIINKPNVNKIPRSIPTAAASNKLFNVLPNDMNIRTAISDVNANIEIKNLNNFLTNPLDNINII